MSSLIPLGASAAVLKQSEPVPDEAVTVQGPNFDQRPTLDTLLESYERIGFQANSLGKAINIVNKMVGAPLSLEHVSPANLNVDPASLAPLR
jgi:deoxyhypusine synthase